MYSLHMGFQRKFFKSATEWRDTNPTIELSVSSQLKRFVAHTQVFKHCESLQIPPNAFELQFFSWIFIGTGQQNQMELSVSITRTSFLIQSQLTGHNPNIEWPINQLSRMSSSQ